MYLYRITIPQGYIFDEILYFWLEPGNYEFGKLEFIRKLSEEEKDEYNKTIRLLEKITVPSRNWNKYKMTTPKGFSFEATLPSGLEPDTYQFGKIEIVKKVTEEEQKHEIFTVLALWYEHLPLEE